MRVLGSALVVAVTLIGSFSFAASQNDIETFCTNIADPARERRYTIKKQKLEDLQRRIEAQMLALESKRAELDEWVSRRDAFADRARESLVEIYSRMRPDAAAERLSLLSDMLAAAILMKLKPSKAGVILNEMETEKAAAISTVIAASGAGSKT